MKINMSLHTLRKILIGSTIVNYLILVTYIFLIVSATVYENYTIFLMSIPAYIISNSWLFIIGFLGIQGLVVVYYLYKRKKEAGVKIESSALEDNSTIELLDENLFIEEIFEGNNSNELLEEVNNREINDISLEDFDEEDLEEDLELSEPELDIELLEAEKEFDLLWEEAIRHVDNANKKKAGESVSIERAKETFDSNVQFVADTRLTDFATPKTEKVPAEKRISKAVIEERNKENKVANPSIIKEIHREFYNEIALNNWIYEDRRDRDRVGLFKPALNETKYREKDISYLIENSILHKIEVPFHSGSFCVYSIYENEDKKIVKNYLAKISKQNNYSLIQKSIAFANYADLGLERKNWRFDFQIGNGIIGAIWISNFLIEDKQTGNFSIAYQNKKELKALLAASQIKFSKADIVALIITDYDFNKQIIKNYITSIGFGNASILTIGEENFENQFLTLLEKTVKR
ncbi:MAG: hypothetical protein FK734_18015 [Asgard group archaeon]|nr:hypothetical protein [Asgard group archaeon]